LAANASLLELLLELQTLDRVPRMGYPLRGVVDPESVTEHTWHVTFLVWVLGRNVQGLDRLRAIELALVHDLAEVRIGDLPLVAARYFPVGAKKAAEAAAAAELLAPLDAEGLALVVEYQQGETLEARLVKACDKLQLMLKVATYERWGSGALEEFWHNEGNFVDGGFAEIADLYRQLRDRRGHAPGGRP
jgi:putative hydrolases of HD superfamily